MINTEMILEFHTIKNKLKEYAHTEQAKQQFEALCPYLEESFLIARLRETTEAKQMIVKYGNPPISAASSIHCMMSSADKGEYLTAEELEQISGMLTSIKRLKDYLERCKGLLYSLPYYDENLDSLETVREEINSKIRGGRVDDYASTILKTIRNRIETAEEKMREKADTILRTNKQWMSDQFSTFRNGRLCLPVKKEYKFKINGMVIDKSSTGNTLFIEPESVYKYYVELEELRLDEENEVRKILYTLTAMLLEKQSVVNQNLETVEKLDFIFAKAKLSVEYDGIEPIIHTKRSIKIVKGRHPLMDRKQNIPLDFQIGNEIRGIVITGPNTGGKTVAIKTVALNCYLAQCGLHVPCEQAEIGMNNLILCDVGDGQNISENLSTFSSHIKNVLEILRQANQESLVIIDELGSGTDPTEGMGIAIAILEQLKKSGCLYLVTTHYPEVKQYAKEEEGILNARMSFDQETLRPLYEMVIGEAGESCAFQIAKRLGMPSDMLERASLAAYHKTVSYENESSREMATAGKAENRISGIRAASIIKRKENKQEKNFTVEFHRGDSVMIYPDKKIGIICETANEKGILRVQLRDKKIWINHKRIKLHVAAEELYPPDYDFSIVFDSVETRKARHQMSRKHTEGLNLEYEKE